jgi:regulator of protease activity HflC (stomatin/prohibitin superfamily)
MMGVLVVSALVTGCSRIESGEIGVRVNASRQVEGAELQTGSWNQTIIGEVLTFPVRDISISLENKTPMTKDNTALADFDITVVYGINPNSVAELFTTKSKSFHAYNDKERDTYLMYEYIKTLVNNASYKAVREYSTLEVADNRAKIEAQILSFVNEQLKAEKLDTSINISVVQIRNVLPNAAVLASATEFVKSENDLKTKANDVKMAKLESDRMNLLSSNSQSIAYMNAQAGLNVSLAILAGKVNTIVVPSDFKGMVNVK